MTLTRLRGNTMKVTKPSGESAAWNVIMPAGTYHRSDFGPKGVLTFDRTFFEKAIANWKKVGSPGLPIDRFHWGSSDRTDIRAEDKAAVGFIEDLRINASGELEGLCAWNADGREDIAADRFRYFSPEFHWDWVDSATGKPQGPTLFGGGLLNDPFFKSLPPLAANDVTAKESTVNKKLLCARLGIPEDSTDEAINAAIEKAETLKAAEGEESKKLTGTVETLKGELKAAVSRAEASDKRIAALEKEKADGAIAQLQDKLLREGRIIAADKPQVEKLVGALGLAEATSLCATWPVKVALGELGIPAKDGDVSQEEAHKKFEALVAAEIAASKCSSREAIRRVAASNRDLAVKAAQVSTTKPAEA